MVTIRGSQCYAHDAMPTMRYDAIVTMRWSRYGCQQCDCHDVMSTMRVHNATVTMQWSRYDVKNSMATMRCSRFDSHNAIVTMATTSVLLPSVIRHSSVSLHQFFVCCSHAGHLIGPWVAVCKESSPRYFNALSLHPTQSSRHGRIKEIRNQSFWHGCSKEGRYQSSRHGYIREMRHQSSQHRRIKGMRHLSSQHRCIQRTIAGSPIACQAERVQLICHSTILSH